MYDEGGAAELKAVRMPRVFTYNRNMDVDEKTSLRGTLEIEKISEICHRYGATRLSVFGSYARDEARSDSDIDFLVEFDKPRSIVHLISMENDLSRVLGREVDLLTRDSISPYLRARIFEESEPIYVKG